MESAKSNFNGASGAANAERFPQIPTPSHAAQPRRQSKARGFDAFCDRHALIGDDQRRIALLAWQQSRKEHQLAAFDPSAKWARASAIRAGFGIKESTLLALVRSGKIHARREASLRKNSYKRTPIYVEVESVCRYVAGLAELNERGKP